MTLATARLPLIERDEVVRICIRIGDALLKDRPLIGGRIVIALGPDDIMKLVFSTGCARQHQRAVSEM